MKKRIKFKFLKIPMTQYINNNKKSKRKYVKAFVIRKFCQKIQKIDVRVKIKINLNNLIKNLVIKARVGSELSN